MTRFEEAMTMPTRTQAQEEKRWREESDARTLATARVIINDTTRLTGAKKAALRMAAEEREELSAMTAVANIKKGTGLREQEKPKPKKRATPATPTVAQYNVFKKI